MTEIGWASPNATGKKVRVLVYFDETKEPMEFTGDWLDVQCPRALIAYAPPGAKAVQRRVTGEQWVHIVLHTEPTVLDVDIIDNP